MILVLSLLVSSLVSSAKGGFAAPQACILPAEEKVDCGYLGIQQEECEAQRSCCWQPRSSGQPWCYYPQRTSSYVVHTRHAEGSRTTLTLSLQQVVPQYGPDFGTLKVLVEPQTPQRLHVKVSPVGGSTPPTADPHDAAPTSAPPRRWEVPEWLIPRPPAEDFDPSASLYSVQLPQQGEPFGFSVLQHTVTQQALQAPQQAVFDTTGTRLVFKEQYLEVTSSLLASATLYGLGETINPSGSLALPRDGRAITLWNYDVAAFNAGTNLYGSHPFILQVHTDGTASGIFLLNSNGMDVELQQTSLTYRVLGGVLDFYFLLGPSPEAVIQQYHEVIGRPAMPPYWALGFHQCRWGYKTLADVEGVVAAYSAAAIPLEVVWTDIDYMYRFRDFTTSPSRFPASQFKEFVDRLHDHGQRWVPITDCGIPHAPDDPAFTSGLAQGVFIKDATGQPYLGQVWPGPTHYPDFLAVNKTWPWWRDQLQRLWDKVPYGGMWIDMNEASNFCDGEVCSLPAAVGLATSPNASSWPQQTALSGLLSRLRRAGGWAGVPQGVHALFHFLGNRMRSSASHSSPQHNAGPAEATAVQNDCELVCRQPSPDNKLAFPPYAINNLHNKVALGSKTLPMTAQHADGQLQYNTHNLYGLSEAAATRWALKNITGRRPFILSRSTFPGSGRFAAHWTGDNAATWQDLRWSVQGLLNSNMWGLAMAGADICGFQGDTTEELCARWIAAGAFYTFSRNHNTLGAAPQELYRWPTVAAAARQALALRYRLLPYLYTCIYTAHTEGGTVARPVFFEFPADQTARQLSTQWMLGRSIMVAPVLQQGAETVQVYFPAATWYSLRDSTLSQGPGVKQLAVSLTDPPPVFVRGGSIVALQEPLNTTDAVRRSPITLLVALDRGRLPNSSSSSTLLASDGTAVLGSSHAAGGVEAPPLLGEQHLQQQHQQQQDGHSNAAGMQGGSTLGVVGDNRPPAAAGGGADGADSLCARMLAACEACAGHAWPAEAQQPCQAGRAGSAGGKDGLQSDGLLLGCGSMYWDHDGESLQVPAEGSVHLLFSSIAQPDTRRGWLMVAAAGADVGAACAGAAAAADLRHGHNPRKPPQDSPLPPVIAEVVVLGVECDLDAGGVFAVRLDGARLPAAQVACDAAARVLRVAGLRVQTSGLVARLEWRAVQEEEAADGLAAVE